MTIEIIISPAGQTKIQTTGFTGSACRDATRDLEKALGTVTAEQLTSEYYASQAQQQLQQRQQRQR